MNNERKTRSYLIDKSNPFANLGIRSDEWSEVDTSSEARKLRDVGFSLEEALVFFRCNDSLQKVPTYHSLIVEPVRAHALEQLRFALIRDEESGVRERELEQKRLARRRVLKIVGGVLSGVAGIVVTQEVGKVFYREYFSPEALARRAIEDAKRDEEKKKMAEEEKNRLMERKNTILLGLAPTNISATGWRVRYSKKESGVGYEEVDEQNVKKIHTGAGDGYRYLSFPGGFFSLSISTNIRVDKYNRTDGVEVPKLQIYRGEGKESEEWILRNQPSEEIDNTVVVFELIENDEVKDVRYVSITQMVTTPEYYRIRYLKKVSPR